MFKPLPKPDYVSQSIKAILEKAKKVQSPTVCPRYNLERDILPLVELKTETTISKVCIPYLLMNSVMSACVSFYKGNIVTKIGNSKPEISTKFLKLLYSTLHLVETIYKFQTSRKAHGKKGYNTCRSISVEYLRRAYPCGKSLETIVTNLIKQKVIDDNGGYYNSGIMSKKYRIETKFAKEPPQMFNFCDLLEEINKFTGLKGRFVITKKLKIDNISVESQTPLLRKLIISQSVAFQNRLSFDKDFDIIAQEILSDEKLDGHITLIRDWLTNPPSRRCYVSDFRFQTPVINFKNEVKRHLVFDGTNKLKEVDFTALHPNLLLIFYAKSHSFIAKKSGIMELLGDFYNNLADLVDIDVSPEDKKTFKQDVNRWINQKCRKNNRTTADFIFDKYFPHFYNWLIKLKKPHDILNKMEMDLMEPIYESLLATGVWFNPAHDGISSLECDSTSVKRIAEEVLVEIYPELQGIEGLVKIK